MKTGTANLPLHYGKAPRWLFERMTKLAGEITSVVVEEQGTEEMLRRLSDPSGSSPSVACWASTGIPAD